MPKDIIRNLSAKASCHFLLPCLVLESLCVAGSWWTPWYGFSPEIPSMFAYLWNRQACISMHIACVTSISHHIPISIVGMLIFPVFLFLESANSWHPPHSAIMWLIYHRFDWHDFLPSEHQTRPGGAYYRIATASWSIHPIKSHQVLDTSCETNTYCSWLNHSC